jgi:phage-related protein
VNRKKQSSSRWFETGDIASAQAIILGELETQFGGSANAARNTLGGALAALKNSFGDLLEGDTGGNGLRGATDGINELTDLLNSAEIKEGFATITNGLLSMAGAAVRALSQITMFTKFMGESFAAAISGPAADDIPRLTDKFKN